MSAVVDFFLSDVDDGLSRTSARDPLGFEVLWTAFGRELVPHLSTVSTGATNFAVLLVLLECVQDHIDQREQGTGLDFADLMVAVDSLHVYSVLDEPRFGLTARLLGKQRAAKLREGGDVLVGPGHEILSSQINLGLYGRYIKPMESMGLVDSKQSLTASAREAVRGWPGFDILRAALSNALRKLDADAVFRASDFDAPEQLRQLREPATLAHFSGLLKESMRIHDGASHRVRTLYLDLARADSVHPQDAEVLLEARRDDPAVADVCDLEWVLCRLDSLFEALFSVSDMRELSDHPGAGQIVEELRGRGFAILTRLVGSPLLSGAALTRLDGLREVVRDGGFAETAARLVEYHGAVMETRKRGAWLDVGPTGSVLVIRSAGDAAKVTARWRRTYYLTSLAAFRSDLEQAGTA